MPRFRLCAALILQLAVLTPAAHAADAAGAVVQDPQQLIVRDTKAGSGPAAQVGNVVDVQYTGWLYNPAAPSLHGTQFDSSVGRGPFSFMLGVGSVIPGWDQGVQGMQVGGKRTLIIPSRLAYGERGAGGDIPPGAVLIFDIELLKLK